LHRVDAGIVGSYFSQSIQSIPSTLSIKEKNEHAIRLLDTLEIQSGEDGELYAGQLKDILAAVEQVPSPERQPILENVVEKVLLYVNNGGYFVFTRALGLADAQV